MDQSFKEVLQEINAMPHKTQYTKDFREPGAIWPAHNSQDLPDTDWYVKDLE